MDPAMSLRCLVPLLLAAVAPCAFAQSSSEDAALADLVESLTSRSAEGLRQFTTPDGAVGIDLGGRFQHVHLAYHDGESLVAACVGSLAEANAFFGRNLRTGARVPKMDLRAIPPEAEAQAALHGMSAAEYGFYWNLIEQAKALQAGEAPAAVTINIVNNDDAGEGFNDPTPTAPEGGNNGATRGEQRLNVFQFAASIWGAFLDSSVPIAVQANFDPLTPCSPSGGVLGSAGPTSAIRDFSGAGFTNTFYPVALANKQNGSDLNGTTAEIIARFNSDVDLGCLGGGSRFYYGLDNATPNNRVNLLVVVLHELGHGLGSLTLTNLSTGNFIGSPPFPDIWTRFMFDRDVGTTWNNMTAAQRAASAINTGNLLWDGPNTKIASGFLTAGRDTLTGRVRLYAPNPLEPGSSVSHWDSVAFPNLLMEPAINPGLPLTLDLSRQQMRDIGWYRDQNLDRVPDTITNVQPSGGTVSVGANVNITWTNTGGFNRNVTIELSTDGGLTFPTVIASDVANTGTRAWTVPNTPTTSARIRVREHDFVEPAGVSTANFTISAGNTAPTFTPVVTAISRQRGSPAGAAVPVGSVNDAETPPGLLTVTQIPGGTATDITTTGIVNNNGAVSAQIAAGCSAALGARTLRFQVSDGSLTGTGDVPLDITDNTPPTLSYNNASVNGGAGTTINPATGPADNGSIASIVVQSQGTYTGGISVNGATGVITISNAAPIGAHTITIRATDNCGATRDASFTLTVNNTPPSFTPAAPISRQQGSPGGAAVTVGTVSDGQTAAGSLTVTQIAGGTASGITVSAIANNAGTISAVVAASCTATAGTVRFQVSDGSLSSTGDLTVNVIPNTPPALGTYPNTQVAVGAATTVTPSAAPTDNGSVDTLTASASAGFTGTLAGNTSSGVVTVGNAGPAGSYTVTVTATDNCGASANRQFTLAVGDALFANGFE
jgi:hypothetical protein